MKKVEPAEATNTGIQKEDRLFRITKRIIDLCFATFVIVLFGWLMVVIWLCIKATSSGPGIFSQERVGQFCQPFTIYKFRTMALGTKQAGTHEVQQSSVIKIGKFLRRTKLDELPQVWNIIKNEISLVGPRPCLPSQTALIEERQKRGVFDVKPGITGHAQIQGVDMSNPEKLAELDGEYVDTRKLSLDLKIIFKTFLGKGGGDKTRG